MDEFRRSFTGVALIFDPTESFAITEGQKGAVWSYLGHLFGQRHLLTRVVVTSILLRFFALSLPILTGLILLAAYFEHYDADVVREFRIMKAMAALRESLWAVVHGSKSRIDFDYDGYRDENYQKLCRVLAAVP